MEDYIDEDLERFDPGDDEEKLPKDWEWDSEQAQFDKQYVFVS